MPDSTQPSDGVITKPSSKSVAQTIDGLRRLMADRGFTVFNVIDHSGVAGRAGVQMPDSKLVMFGKPAAGAAVMLAAPLAALDIPLKVLVWEDRNGVVSVSYNAPGFLAGRYHLEGALRAPFDAVESIIEALAACISPIDKCCLCGCRERFDAQVAEEGLHADPEGLVVTVHAGPVCGRTAAAGTVDSSEDRRYHVVAEGQ